VAAFRAFYDQTLPRVYSYLYHRCGNEAFAEELTQETYIAAVAELKKGKVVSDSLAWIFGIARHKLVDHYRREERGGRLAARMPLDVAADHELDGIEQRELTHRALAGLPAVQRSALVLRYLDGLPVADVARQLGKSLHATESLLARGRDGFRRVYAEVARD
jgi:RNA polymerase sigma-70 factor (ECF subfamily)